MFDMLALRLIQIIQPHGNSEVNYILEYLNRNNYSWNTYTIIFL